MVNVNIYEPVIQAWNAWRSVVRLVDYHETGDLLTKKVEANITLCDIDMNILLGDYGVIITYGGYGRMIEFETQSNEACMIADLIKKLYTQRIHNKLSKMNIVELLDLKQL